MNAQRVLIVKPSSLGDIVHSLPFLHVLRRGLPQAHLAWMVSRSNLDLLAGHPDLDEVIVFERERWGGLGDFCTSVHELSRFIRELRARRFDLVVDLQGLLRSGLFGWLSGASRRVGFGNARELSHLFYSVRVDVPDAEMHAVDRYLRVAAAMGLPTDGTPTFDVPMADADRAFAEDTLAMANPEGRPLVVMLPSSRWRTKRWPPEYFASLSDRAVDALGACVLFLGSRADVSLVDAIRARMKGRALSLAGRTTLKQSAALMTRAAAVVANDSGPMHLAVALDRPVVALYGPTSPARTGPYGGRTRVLHSERDCVPCFRDDCDDVDCMHDIGVSDVFEALAELMETAS